MEDYFLGIEKQYKTGHALEHAYRPDLQRFFETAIEGVTAVNDPKHSEHGAPDFALIKGSLILGYAEAKDVNVNLDAIAKSEQLKRYFGYSNLILTNYIDFRFYRNGEEWCPSIDIAHFEHGQLIPNKENYDLLARSIKDFYNQAPEKIRSANRLTKIMGGRARRIRDNVTKYLETENDKNKDLVKIYEVIKKNLVHDITHKHFADMYAQTLVYGLFVARYHDASLATFSRQEARDLIPASNPFLQNFFDHLAGANFDIRLRYIVDELCEIFQVSDVKELMNDYKKDRDPVIHFYEDFLLEYDSDLRKKMGVFYTPAPVVSFIVRAVDDILKKAFNLVNGIADTSKITVEKEIQGKKKKIDVHRVQVLDPATGTGTFLNEIIKHIHTASFSKEQSLWNSYVNKELLPRLHGFELMMASYTIAHLKIAMTLRDTGVSEFKERIGIYLTNSLEEAKVVPDDLFGSFGLMDTITKESSEASRIKSEYPVMVVIGNPPYSVSSDNKGDWIQNEIKEYKKDLNEKKLNLDDDYIKFIRFGEYLIENNQEGVLAMITNNSFISGVTHRQMRKHLLETFDEIYVVDLHGNARAKETAPDGSKDENVFNIMAGVSINIFVKKSGGKKKDLGKVFHFDVHGKRNSKFDYLNGATMTNIKWAELAYSSPYYFFVPKDFSLVKKYEEGFRVADLFQTYSAGIKTKVDNVAVDFDRNELGKRIKDIIESKYLLKEVIKKYNLSGKTTWEFDKVLLIKNFEESKVSLYSYRPFDERYTYYDKNFLSRSRSEVMDNFYQFHNIGLETSRNGDYLFISKNISDEHFISDNSFKFPLYLYSDDGSKTPNLDKDIWHTVNEIVGDTTPENIFDYIYAVLHSPKYRETYKEFLKIDFPRVPYPKSKDEFWNLVPLGTRLRELHLLTSPELESFNLGITFVGEGEAIVEKPVWSGERRVYINSNQFFDGVDKDVYDFYIGGYQPAQKWLKDRKGRTLTAEDIIHYKKMCVAMKRTIEIMKEIDKSCKLL